MAIANLEKSEKLNGFRELHKKDDPILWDGYPTRLYIISRQDACTTINFGKDDPILWDGHPARP